MAFAPSLRQTMNKLYLLQVLRAFAAGLVVVDHAFDKTRTHSPFIGAFAVYIFFVISGFIIFYSSKTYFNAADGCRRFLIRRFRRIAPIYYLATLLILWFDAIGGKGSHTPMQVLASFCFIPYWRIQDLLMRPVLGQGWTLVYEMFFYVCFALCLLVNRKKGLTLLFTAFLSISCAGSVLLLSGNHLRDASNAVEFYTHPIILLFLIGVLLGIWHEAAPPPAIGFRYALLVGMIVIAFNLRLLTQVTSATLPIGVLLTLWLSAGVLVFLCVFSDETSLPPGLRWLESLGDYSYSVYLFHEFIIIAVWRFYKNTSFATKGGYLSVAVFSAVCLLSTFAVSALIYTLVERHLCKPSFWSRCLARRRPEQPAQTLA
jgi:exopolysaccharide production protein ExoZ